MENYMRYFAYGIFILLAVALLFGLNYKLFSFEKGLVQTNFDTNSIIDDVTFVADIDKIYYYDSVVGNDYIFIVSTRNYGNFVFTATEQDITYFQIGGIFENDLSPVKITPIHWGWFIVLFLLLNYIGPSKPKRKIKKE